MNSSQHTVLDELLQIHTRKAELTLHFRVDVSRLVLETNS